MALKVSVAPGRLVESVVWEREIEVNEIGVIEAEMIELGMIEAGVSVLSAGAWLNLWQARSLAALHRLR